MAKKSLRTKEVVSAEVGSALAELIAVDLVLGKAQEKLNALQTELREIVSAEGGN